MDASRYGVPPLDPALARSKVHHRLRLTRQEKVQLCLALFAYIIACLGLLLLLVALFAPDRFPASRDEFQSSRVTPGSDRASSTTLKPLSSLWAPYSPYHPAGKYEAPIREGCVLSQVNILQRHGARYPTSGAAKLILKALKKLQAATTYHDPNLHFLKNYTYDLGVNDLVQFGADQSHALGKETFKRYREFIAESGDAPFVRAAGSPRVVFSAQNWTLGFTKASKQTFPAKVDLVISEQSNNTLANKMCPAGANLRRESQAFIDIAVESVAARLNSVAPGANLVPQDVYAIMHLCPFETVAKEELSPFCSVFSRSDFKLYEYAWDLEKFYYSGYGGPLGAVQGVGYINELIGRLTNSPPLHGLQTNKTLLSSPKTFPLNRAMYVDFSHDNLMVAVFTAMGLFKQTNGPLDTTKITEDRTWIISKMVPFSGRMTVERLSCPRPLVPSISRSMRWWNWMTVDGVADYYSEQMEDYVRVFVNDARQRLEFCGAGEDGMCKLDEFVKSQRYARNDGVRDFEKCNHTGW
ncbi:phytase [Thelephora terrestris]|uniref:Phytase A n=1 Tax=Thelephora terrestris TaxID=56493 RepID=A0A9P6L0U0_9AGAM|nr:phytase [Thelephora terrestris]